VDERATDVVVAVALERDDDRHDDPHRLPLEELDQRRRHSWLGCAAPGGAATCCAGRLLGGRQSRGVRA